MPVGYAHLGPGVTKTRTTESSSFVVPLTHRLSFSTMMAHQIPEFGTSGEVHCRYKMPKARVVSCPSQAAWCTATFRGTSIRPSRRNALVLAQASGDEPRLLVLVPVGMLHAVHLKPNTYLV